MFDRTRSKRISASAESPRNAWLLGAKSLVANSVYDAEGHFVGKLEEIVIDTRTGCVRHAVLAVGGVMGIGRKRVAVPWSALSPDADYRRCVVDRTQMQLTAKRVPDDDPWLQRNESIPAAESPLRQARAFGARLTG